MHGRVRGVGERGMPDREILRLVPAQKGLAQDDLGGLRHVETELHLLLLVCLGSAALGLLGSSSIWYWLLGV